MQITFEADVHERAHLIRLRDELETCLRMVQIAIGNADKLKKGKGDATKLQAYLEENQQFLRVMFMKAGHANDPFLGELKALLKTDADYPASEA